MLEFPIVEYSIAYQYNDKMRMEIYKVGEDWGWVVRTNGTTLGCAIVGSEAEAERAALDLAGSY